MAVQRRRPCLGIPLPLPRTTMAETIFASTFCSDHERTTSFILPMWSHYCPRISKTTVSGADRPSLLLYLATASSLRRVVHGTRENSFANNSSRRSIRTSSHLSLSMWITSFCPCQQVAWSILAPLLQPNTRHLNSAIIWTVGLQPQSKHRSGRGKQAVRREL